MENERHYGHEANNLERTLSLEQREKLLNTLKARFVLNTNRHEGIEWSKVESRLNEAEPAILWSLNEMERTGGEPDVIGIVESTGEVEFWDFSEESPEGRRMICYDREGQDKVERQGYNTMDNVVDIAQAIRLRCLVNEEPFETNKKLFCKVECCQIKAKVNEALPENLQLINDPVILEIGVQIGKLKIYDYSNESLEEQEKAERQVDSPRGNAVDMAKAMGLGGLLNEEQYRKLQHFGEFDKHTSSWIDTPQEPRERGVALVAFRVNGDVDVFGDVPHFHNKYRAFRCWLRV